MVGKLFKHEINYYKRSLMPVYIVLAGVALVGRIIEFFEEESTAYSVLRGTSIFALVMVIIATMVLTLIFSITRYYKNMFTGEGYLTMTLPVTPTSHLLVKMTSAVLVNIVSVIASVLAVCVFTVGQWLNEIVKAVIYIWNYLAELSEGQLIFYCLELIPVLLVTMASSVLMYYMCISVGQTFHKNRVLAAVGVYFGLYVVFQVLSSIGSVFVGILMEEIGFYYTKEQYLIAIHVIMVAEFIWGVIISLIYFLISKLVLTKKLNLE